MPLVSSTPIAIPDGPDSVMVSLTAASKFVATGVSTSASMSVTHYKQADGQEPIQIGKQKTVSFPEVEKSAATDADLATCFGEIEAALQKYIAAKGL